MSNEKISFKNSAGKQLSAKLYLPADRKPHNYAIFAHCFTCNQNFTAVRYISAALAAEGFGVLSFDFTGLGMSEGDFSETNFSGSVDDLISAANFLEENYQAPTVIIGHSLGGAAALLAASEMEAIKAVATIGTPCAPQHVTNLLAGGIEEIDEKGAAEINIGGRPFTIKKQFVDDLERSESIKRRPQDAKGFSIYAFAAGQDRRYRKRRRSLHGGVSSKKLCVFRWCRSSFIKNGRRTIRR